MLDDIITIIKHRLNNNLNHNFYVSIKDDVVYPFGAVLICKECEADITIEFDEDDKNDTHVYFFNFKDIFDYINISYKDFIDRQTSIIDNLNLPSYKECMIRNILK